MRTNQCLYTVNISNVSVISVMYINDNTKMHTQVFQDMPRITKFENDDVLLLLFKKGSQIYGRQESVLFDPSPVWKFAQAML